MADTKPAKIAPDWERIEIDYRAGLLSLREMAAKHGPLTEGAIRKRAKRDGWERGGARESDRPIKAELLAKGKRAVAGFIYVIYLDSPGCRFYKIGMTSHFGARFDAHQCASPFDLCVACSYFTPDMRAEESALHRKFAEKHERGEWFRLTREDVAEIASRGCLV